MSLILIKKVPESLQFSVSPGVTLQLKIQKEFLEALGVLFPLVQMLALLCGSSWRRKCTAGAFPEIDGNW